MHIIRMYIIMLQNILNTFYHTYTKKLPKIRCGSYLIHSGQGLSFKAKSVVSDQPEIIAIILSTMREILSIELWTSVTIAHTNLSSID